MQIRGFLLLTLALTAMTVAGFGALRTAEEDDLLEQISFVAYPYEREDTAAALFSEPDQSLLDEASGLPCPEGSEKLYLPDFSMRVCLPPGWDMRIADSVTEGPSGPWVSLTSRISRSVPEDNWVLTAVVFKPTSGELDPDIDCPRSGQFALRDREAEVCFHPAHLRAAGLASATSSYTASRSFTINIPDNDGQPAVIGFVIAENIRGPDIPDLSDRPFREAMAILANLRFE